MNTESVTLVMIPKQEWTAMLTAQQTIVNQLMVLSQKPAEGIAVKHITAKEFMDLVRIKRTKFDQLVQLSKIKTVKKKRKIYVPVSEVERYFSDPSIP